MVIQIFRYIKEDFPNENWQKIFIYLGYIMILNPIFWIAHLIIYHNNKKEEKNIFGKYFKRRVFYGGIILLFCLAIFGLDYVFKLYFNSELIDSILSYSIWILILIGIYYLFKIHKKS